MTHSLYVKLSKNSKDYGEPDITYQLAGAAEQRPTMPRISGIQVGNGQDLVGFRESELKHKEVERVFPENKTKINKRYSTFASSACSVSLEVSL